MGGGPPDGQGDKPNPVTNDKHKPTEIATDKDEAIDKLRQEVWGPPAEKNKKSGTDSTTQKGEQLTVTTETSLEIKPEESLSAQERHRFAYLQKAVKYMLPQLKELTLREETSNQPNSLAELVQKAERGDYQATIRLFPTCVRVLQNEVPSVIKELSDMKLALPPGCPIELPIRDGYPAISEWFEGLIKSHELPLNLSQDTSKLLQDDKQIVQLVQSVEWLQKANASAQNTIDKYDAEQLQQQLKQEYNAPSTWDMPKDEAKLQGWMQSTQEMLNLMNRVRNYAQAYKTLEGITPDLKESALKELQLLAGKDKNGTENIEFDKYTGKLTRCNLPMPKDLRLDLPENQATIQQLENWLKKWSPDVDKALESYTKGYTSFLRYGDFEEHGSIVFDKDNKVSEILDQSGQVTTIVKGDGETAESIHRNADGKFIDKSGQELTVNPPDNGSKLEKFDYAQHKFETKTLPDGNIEITISHSFEKTHDFDFYKAFGKEVASTEETRIVKPSDYIGVVSNTTHKVELLRADQLGKYLSQQKFFHYGGKAANVIVDVGFVVVGAPEAAAALKAGRIGAAALSTTRALAGLTGVFSPALRDTTFGDTVLTARHAFMIGDMSLNGLALPAYRLVSSTKATTEAGSLLSRVTHTGTAITTTPIFGYQIYDGIRTKIQSAQGDLPAQRLNQAQEERGLPEKFFDKSSGDRRLVNSPWGQQDKVKDMLSNYSSTLESEMTDETTKEQVKAIFKKTQDLLSLDESSPESKKVKEEEIEHYKTELSGYFLPSGKEVLLNRVCQDEYNYPSKLKTSLESDLAGKKLSDKDDHPKEAAAIALIMLSSHNTTGELPSVLATKVETLPRHEHQVTRKNQSKDGHIGLEYVEAEKVTQKLSTQDVLNALFKQASSAPEHSSRLIGGEMLWSAGKLTSRQLAGIYLDIINDKNASESLKARAILNQNGPGLGILINELKNEEHDMSQKTHGEQLSYLAHTYGLTSDDINACLLKLAADPPEAGKSATSSNLRALALASLYANEQPTLSKRAESLDDTIVRWHQYGEQSSLFAQKTIDLLKSDLDKPIPETQDPSADKIREDKIRAALMLATAGKLPLSEKEYVLSASEFNKRLLECIQAPGKPNSLKIDENRADIALSVITNLKHQDLSTAERAAIINLLDQPTSSTGMENVKKVILLNLKGLLDGDDPNLQQLRISTREKLQAMIDLKSNEFTGQFGSLRLATVSAISEIGYSDDRTINLLKGLLLYNEQSKNFRDRLPAVRFAALDALYKVDPNIAYEIAKNHQDYELDPAIGKLSKTIRDTVEMQKLGDPRKTSEKAQHIEAKLTEPHKCDFNEGEKFIKETEFKLLTWKGLNERLSSAYKDVYGDTVEGDLDRGFQISGWSLGTLWDRISNLSWDEPDQRLNAAASAVWSEYAPLSLKLGQLAKDEQDPRSPQAINAIGYLLKTKGADLKDSDRSVILENVSLTLEELCKGNKNRDMVATQIESLLTGEPELDARAQRHLLNGLHTLLATGAITEVKAARIVSKALEKTTDDQVIRKPTDSDYAASIILQQDMLRDLLQYRVRDERLGIIEGIKNRHPDAAVREVASYVWSKLRDGTDATRQDVLSNPDEGTSASERAQQIEQALKTPGDNCEQLVRAIYKSAIGLPIESSVDPRLPLLIDLAQSAIDDRVKLAAAQVLLQVEAEERSYKREALHALAEISLLGPANRPGCVREAQEKLNELMSLDVKWVYAVKDAIQYSGERQDGIFKIISETYNALDVDLRLSGNNEQKARKLEQILSMKDIPNAVRARAIIEAAGKDDVFVEGDPRVPLLRRTLLESTSQQVRLASAWCLTNKLASPATDSEQMSSLPELSEHCSQHPDDISMALDVMLDIQDNGTNPTIRSEAKVMIQNLEMSGAEFSSAVIQARYKKAREHYSKSR